MADKPLTVLQAALMEAVRPTQAGRVDRVQALTDRLPKPGPLEAHGCLHAAVVVYRGRRVWYPCRSHEGGVHRFLARLDACPAPWCRLPASHAIEGTMHDIPAGTVEIHDAIGTVNRD